MEKREETRRLEVQDKAGGLGTDEGVKSRILKEIGLNLRTVKQ